MSEVNIKAELKKYCMTLRAFENAYKVAEEVENLDGTLQKKKKELEEIDARLKSSKAILEKELDKISDEIEQVRQKAMEEIDALRGEHKSEKDGLVKKIAGLNEDAKKLDAKIKAKVERSTELDIEIAQKEKDLNLFNKEIEDTKTKFRSMF